MYKKLLTTSLFMIATYLMLPSFVKAVNVVGLANVSAEIKKAFTYTEDTPLDLGAVDIEAGSSGSTTLALDASTGVASLSNTTGFQKDIHHVPTLGLYTLTPADSTTVSVTIVVPTTTLTLVGGTDTLSFTPVLSASSLSLTGGVAQTFNIGGSLVIPASAATGIYSGSFLITFQY